VPDPEDGAINVIIGGVLVVSHEEAAWITIGSDTFEGWIDDVTCEKCNSRRIYYDTYDAFFCPPCNRWLEDICRDATCRFCITRPSRPLRDEKPA
jgi:hypothetical protein